MANQESLLGKLLNDESFIRWLEGNASPVDKGGWDRWLLKNPENQRMVKKARKILNMPFKTIRTENQIAGELDRLKNSISDSKKTSG